MAMYNADGSEGAMCGNGIRCLAKYVYDKGLTSRKQISVETRSGIKRLILTVKDQKVSEVQVDMGRPELTAAKIPVRSETERAQNVPVRIRGRDFLYTAVSMGNPHAVVQVKDAAGLDLARFGRNLSATGIFLTGSIRSSWRFWIRKPSGCVSGRGAPGKRWPAGREPVRLLWPQWRTAGSGEEV